MICYTDGARGLMQAHEIVPKKYKSYTLANLRSIQQLIEHCTDDRIFGIEVVGNVYPFKTNNYVVEELIDWGRVPYDPMFILTFPQREMLPPAYFDEMAAAIRAGDKKTVRDTANKIRMRLNPHPAGQLNHNVPTAEGVRLPGMQHKYPETVLFFPSQGQTCHAYCTFCFRWPQFVGMEGMKFAMREVDLLIDYLRDNPRVSDVLFTGGDPLVMTPRLLRNYIEPLLEADLDTLHIIRIGTKTLSYWPYKFLTDEGADDLLDLMAQVTSAGKHLAVMAHVNHSRELSTPAFAEAVRRIRATGAQIRSQTPLLRQINDTSEELARKWRMEVSHCIVPYYMFVVRDTGAQEFFGVPLIRAWEIFQAAYQRISGLGRTMRGPSMSAEPGKVEILGPARVNGEKVLTLRFLQGRNPDWAGQIFFAEYDEQAIWLEDLKPAFGENRFWWEPELERIYEQQRVSGALFQEVDEFMYA